MTLDLDIDPSERVAVMGMTDSGKTYFNRALLSKAHRLVVIDPKGLLYNLTNWNLQRWDEGIKRLERGHDVRLWIAPPRSVAEYEEWFDRILQLRNVIVYIDELYGVGPSSGSEGLRALFTRGRELGIGVWSAFQRPRWVPIYAMSEAEWVVMFRLEMRGDREYMAERMGAIALRRLDGHACLVYHGGRTVVLPNGITVRQSKVVSKPNTVVL